MNRGQLENLPNSNQVSWSLPAREFSKHQRISRGINANTNSSVLIFCLEANSVDGLKSASLRALSTRVG